MSRGVHLSRRTPLNSETVFSHPRNKTRKEKRAAKVSVPFFSARYLWGVKREPFDSDWFLSPVHHKNIIDWGTTWRLPKIFCPPIPVWLTGHLVKKGPSAPNIPQIRHPSFIISYLQQFKVRSIGCAQERWPLAFWRKQRTTAQLSDLPEDCTAFCNIFLRI